MSRILLLLAVASCAPDGREDAPIEPKAVSQSATAPALGTTQSFAVLAGSTVTNTGSSVVTGNLGVSPGLAVTGFPPGLVLGGTIHAGDATAAQAQSDATTAYNALASQPCDQNLSGQDLGGMTLTSGTYCFSSSAQLTGTLTLDAQGNPGSIFIIKTGSTLTTASNSKVVIINGGSSCNVFFQIGSSATLGTGSAVMGSLFALTSITLTTGASLQGRAIARNGAVTLDTNSVNATVCSVAAVADAGSVVPDAGVAVPDAGTMVVNDAGTVIFVDAGIQELDAGMMTYPDAGVATHDAGECPEDAGTVIVPVVDAGPVVVIDAGVMIEDAGYCEDAGTLEVDAGVIVPVVDAGTPDAGLTCEAVCDLQTDHNNCGVCGNVCGATEACVAGVCVCNE